MIPCDDCGRVDLYAETWNFSTEALSCPENPGLLQSSTKHFLAEMFKDFGNKWFIKFRAQGYEQHILINAYRREEESFLRTLKRVQVS